MFLRGGMRFTGTLYYRTGLGSPSPDPWSGIGEFFEAFFLFFGLWRDREHGHGVLFLVLLQGAGVRRRRLSWGVVGLRIISPLGEYRRGCAMACV